MSEWIRYKKIEGFTPELNERVLTISVSGYISVSFLLEDETWDNTLLITHWQPLPEPPATVSPQNPER